MVHTLMVTGGQKLNKAAKVEMQPHTHTHTHTAASFDLLRGRH